MSARPYYHPDAGRWVAYRDEPRRRYEPQSLGFVAVPGETTRCYLYNESGVGAVGGPEQCVRFDTKAEALAAARARWPRSVRGCRIGAEQVREGN